MGYFPRSAWGGDTPSAGRLGRVSVIAIHHTASTGAPATFDAARWKRLERGEQANGYSSLAYHFGFNDVGDTIEIRGWGQKGAATGGWNDRSVAFVYDGYFHPPHNDVPTDAAIMAMADWITVGVYLGFIDPNFTVEAHGTLTAGTQWATACPGDNLRPRVKGFASIEAIAKFKLSQAPADTPIQVPPSAPAAPRCVNVCSNRTLKRGSSGVCVKTAQRLLAARGFNPGPQDGQFGAKTDAAVRCFQNAAGLSADGVVGPQTWAALGG